MIEIHFLIFNFYFEIILFARTKLGVDKAPGALGLRHWAGVFPFPRTMSGKGQCGNFTQPYSDLGVGRETLGVTSLGASGAEIYSGQVGRLPARITNLESLCTYPAMGPGSPDYTSG